MNHRLQKFLAAENISQSQFADSIGVARASVSHIIAGRNKPGFDFIESMSRSYPDLNLEWLITGKGKMYKSAAESAAATSASLAAPVSSQPAVPASSQPAVPASSQPAAPAQANAAPPATEVDDMLSLFDEPAPAAASPMSRQASGGLPQTPQTPLTAPVADTISTIASSNTTQIINNKRNITKIIVFYDDNTYQELN